MTGRVEIRKEEIPGKLHSFERWNQTQIIMCSPSTHMEVRSKACGTVTKTGGVQTSARNPPLPGDRVDTEAEATLILGKDTTMLASTLKVFFTIIPCLRPHNKIKKICQY